MKRALIILAVVVLVAGGAFAATGAGGDKGDQYKMVFDNAFGLVEGADFKVGGVAVGSIEKLDLQRRDARALVTVAVKRAGFGGLRTDARCVISPQSLIGEYFIDCQPGRKGEVLKSGATLPVRNTESPIPPDLVLNIMRMPERERFSIILGELGAGLAARGDDLNETIRRSIPAIQATNKVLKILGDNRATLQALARDSGQVLKVLGERREDVGRFVSSAEDLATTTASRREALAETFRRFPGFLDELTPTMTDLGITSRELTPTLADLREAAPSVRSLLATLRPFSSALQPATTSLGEASRSGRTAAREASSLVQALGGLGANTPEPAKNLRILLDDLDDRSRAYEPDPDSPEGKGYTGLEAPLQYIFDQALALNVFDQRGYSLKLNINPDECTDYTTADEAKEEPERYARCNQNLGPNQPGITTPDPSPPLTATRRAAVRDRDGASGAPQDGEPAPVAPEPTAPDKRPEASPTPKPLVPGLPPVQKLLDDLLKPLSPVLGGKDGGGLLGKNGLLDPEKLQEAQNRLDARQESSGAQDLLDFLLAP